MGIKAWHGWQWAGRRDDRSHLTQARRAQGSSRAQHLTLAAVAAARWACPWLRAGQALNADHGTIDTRPLIGTSTRSWTHPRIHNIDRHAKLTASCCCAHLLAVDAATPLVRPSALLQLPTRPSSHGHGHGHAHAPTASLHPPNRHLNRHLPLPPTPTIRSAMAWHDKDGWLTAALSPTPTAILLTLAVALLLPVLLHAWLYRSAAKAADKPIILLLGPTGAGKTALTTLVCANLPSAAVLARFEALLAAPLTPRRPNVAPWPPPTRPQHPSPSRPRCLSPISPPPLTTAPPATRPSSVPATSSS
jgi:hypothetical protein